MTDFIGWISKFFWNEKTSVEADYTEEVDNILEEYLETNICEETFTGVVTNVKPGFVEIDSRYFGKIINDFKVGENVSYVVRKTRNNEVITDIKPLDGKSEWKTSYNNLIGFIENREGPLIYVNDVSYSLEGVEAEFVPCKDDKVYLTIREGIKNSKKVLELVEIKPNKKCLSTGIITKWDGFEGIINDNIYFSRNYCNMPTKIDVGDRVLTIMIESKKDNFQYRATYIELSRKTFKTKSVFIEEVANVFVIQGQEKFIEVNVFNLSSKWQHITSFSMEPNSEEIRLVEPIGLRSIPPEMCIPYKFCLKPSFSEGKLMIKLLWNFNRFTLGRSFTVKLLRDGDELWDVNKETNNQIVLNAPRWSRKANYRLMPLDSYTVPEPVNKLISGKVINDVTSIIFDLQNIVPSILNELSPSNYKRNFHTLVHMEELATINSYSELDMVVALNKRGEDIVLKLEFDTSHYDMLSFGDKIYAAIIWDESIIFEGNIADITPVEIVARFHPKLLADFVDGRLYKIKFKPGRMNFRRQHQAIDKCSNILESRLFPKCVSSDLSNYNLFEASKGSWVNSELNEEQKNAIINILKQREGDIPYIIFGPPGSGKTVTLVELILQIVRLKPFSKMLVVAPSNSAVDAIALSLVNSGVLMKQQILRLGSLRYFLRGEKVVGLNDVAFFLSDSEKDRTLNIPLIDYEILGKHNVTLGTFSTIGSLTSVNFKKAIFSHIIIDEAGQVTEPECLIPLKVLSENIGNIVLCGDPLQLGPVIFSKTAAILGLHKSFLSRLVDKYPYLKDLERFPSSLGYDPRILTKLVLNYRALPELVNMSSCLFYNNELKPTLLSNSPEAKLLEQIKLNFKWNEMGSVLFHHVPGEEEQPVGSTSWVNIPEAMKVAIFVVKLFSAGVDPDQIGIITPYKKQSMMISQFIQELNILLPKLGSVEEFQGLEKEIIILSLVRSNNSNPNSFINESRRINVATSRAKALLLIVGNKPVLLKNQIWKQILELCQEINY